MEEVHKKREKIEIMKFTDIDVSFDITSEGDQNWSKILSEDLLTYFKSDHKMSEEMSQAVLSPNLTTNSNGKCPKLSFRNSHSLCYRGMAINF